MYRRIGLTARARFQPRQHLPRDLLMSSSGGQECPPSEWLHSPSRPWRPPRISPISRATPFHQREKPRLRTTEAFRLGGSRLTLHGNRSGVESVGVRWSPSKPRSRLLISTSA